MVPHQVQPEKVSSFESSVAEAELEAAGYQAITVGNRNSGAGPESQAMLSYFLHHDRPTSATVGLYEQKAWGTLYRGQG